MGGGSFVPKQQNWRFMQDDGAEPTNQYEAENTTFTMSDNGDILRLRVALVETGGKGSNNVSLKFEWSTDDSSFNTPGSASAWNYANGQATEGNTPTTNKLTDVSNGGEYVESSGGSGTFDFAASTGYEFDFAITPGSGVSGGTLYYFRFLVNDAEVVLNTAESHPNCTTASAPVELSGTAAPVSSTSSTLKRIVGLVSAAVIATSSISADVGAIRGLSGTSACVSGASASLTTESGVVHSLDGASACVSAASANLSLSIPLDGASSAASVTSGSLSRTLALKHPEVFQNTDLEEWDGANDPTWWVSGQGGTSSVNQEGSVVNAGQYSVRLDIDASSNIAYIQNLVTLDDRFYTLSVYYRNPTAGKKCAIQIYDSASNVWLGSDGTWQTQGPISFFALPDSTGSYSKHEITFRRHPSYTSYWVRFRNADNTGSASLYFDTLSLRNIIGETLTSSASLKGSLKFSASATCVSATAASLKTTREVSAAATCTSSAVAALSSRRPLVGSASAVSSVQTSGANVARGIDCSAVCVSATAAQAKLSVALTGDCNAISSADADISIRGQQPLAGTSVGISDASASLSATLTFTASASAGCSATGEIGRTRSASGTALPVSDASASLRPYRKLESTSTALSAASATIDVEREVSGSATPVSAASASLTVTEGGGGTVGLSVSVDCALDATASLTVSDPNPVTVEGNIEIGDVELKSWIDTITYLFSTIVAS